MLRGHMKCCPSAVTIFLLKGDTIPYLVKNVWYLVWHMWLPSRCTSHSLSSPYLEPPKLVWFGIDIILFTPSPQKKIYISQKVCSESMHRSNIFLMWH